MGKAEKGIRSEQKPKDIPEAKYRHTIDPKLKEQAAKKIQARRAGMLEEWKQEKENKAQQAGEEADFRFKHSEEIRDLILSDPTRTLEGIQHEHLGWREVMEVAQAVPEDPTTGSVWESMLPYIWDWPLIVEVDVRYTLVGGFLGDQSGRVYLEIEEAGETRTLSTYIFNWSRTAVEFKIMPTEEGIPFHKSAKLFVERRSDQKSSDGKPTTVEPVALVYFGESNELSDKGRAPYYNTSVEYHEPGELFSPVMPEQARVFYSPYLDNGMRLYCETHSLYYYPHDEEGTVERTDGPLHFPSTNKLHALVTVHDDWAWDFTVWATFYIIIPIGFSASSGWSQT